MITGKSTLLMMSVFFIVTMTRKYYLIKTNGGLEREYDNFFLKFGTYLIKKYRKDQFDKRCQR